MRTRTVTIFATVALLTLALTGCRTTRQTEDTASAAFTRKQRNVMLVPLAQYPKDVKFVSAKTAITLDYNGHAATVKGRLRMRRDEVVHMSVTALGLVEIAVVEFNPKGAYIIDKVNKRYARFDYSSGLMNLAGVNFNAVQALFWNRLFIPGEKEVWRHTGDFAVTDAGAQYLVEPNRQRMLKCQFYIDTDCKQLNQTNLRMQQYNVTWRYDRFDSIDDYSYPTAFDVSVSGSSRAVGARIGLSDVSTLDTGWYSSTDFSRYKEVDLSQLMEIFNMIR